ncbi:hypothetical protein JOB18_022339 [Solea senegalensis]|uniref:Uncharacterized protein n=1 Tax=Solea senegalensis TaxID=28829 RepID=A0AAV6PP37_SOLSE|nr:hypothetical protein JOB18_022339 [Solea senegalensis]
MYDSAPSVPQILVSGFYRTCKQMDHVTLREIYKQTHASLIFLSPSSLSFWTKGVFSPSPIDRLHRSMKLRLLLFITKETFHTFIHFFKNMLIYIIVHMFVSHDGSGARYFYTVSESVSQ